MDGKVFKLSFGNKDTFTDFENDEFVFGFEDNAHNIDNSIITKLNNGLSKLGTPWNAAIPYMNNMFFVWGSKDALLTFLFNLCELTTDDITKLIECGLKLYFLNIEAYSNGFSRFRGTVYMEEVIDITEIDVLNSKILEHTYNVLSEVKTDSKTISSNKSRYYTKYKNNIKFK